MRIDTGLLQEMRGFGAFDVRACFNCGSCTAVCPLSQESDAFPRRIVRYAQLGQGLHLAASKELWLCHYCAQCSDTCPREADPGGFMAAARRYAIAGFDPTSLARRLYRSATFTAAAVAVLFALLLAILLVGAGGLPTGRATTQDLLRFISYERIHWLGVAVVVVVAVVVAATLVNMLWMLSRAPVPGGGLPAKRPESFPLSCALRAAERTLADIVAQRTYRGCAADSLPAEPLLVRRWLVHLAIMVGMLGLAAATVLDYLLKTPGSAVPIWYPPRLLGTVAGALLIYGSVTAIVQRLRRPDSYHSQTLLSDWLLLGFLVVVGASGFILELAEYSSLEGWVSVVFVVHIASALELILLLPFTKLAHIVYRPVAMWFTEFRRLRVTSE